jgi:DNA-binding NarL/FixJ family response regulator
MISVNEASIRLLIADDHPLFRKGLRTLLGAIPDFAVVGEAETGPEAVAISTELQPDVILMDLQMPGGSGIQATREIMSASPNARILVVTLFEDDDSVFAAIRSGARGYILKDTDEEEMVRAIRAVAHGEAIFGPAVATRVLAYLTNGLPDAPPQSFPSLTEREREILNLMARGLTNPVIARTLSLSPKTIANHVSNIFSKLQVADRVEAVIRAREAGLG